jgi:hypothetical protein
LEIKSHIHAAKLNREDFIFFHNFTSTIQGLLLEISDAGKEPNVLIPQHVPVLLQSICKRASLLNE